MAGRWPRFLRDYTPSRIVMLLETLKRHKVPDLEAVFNSGDYPVRAHAESGHQV